MHTFKNAIVVMVPTSDRFAPICIYKGSNKPTTNTDLLAYHSNQHLLVLSDDDITEGDLFYYETEREDGIGVCNFIKDGRINDDFLVFRGKGLIGVRKIIATTDKTLKQTTLIGSDGTSMFKPLPHLERDSIQKFCDAGGGNLKVLVEYVQVNRYNDIVTFEDLDYPDLTGEYDFKLIPKISSDNTINIRLVKKVLPLEDILQKISEVEDRLMEDVGDDTNYIGVAHYIELLKEKFN